MHRMTIAASGLALAIGFASAALAQEIPPEKIQILAQPGGAIVIGQPGGFPGGPAVYSSGPQFGLFPGGGSMGLLYDDNVRGDLSITEEQWRSLQDAQQRIQQQMRESLMGLRDLAPEERQKRFEEIRKKMEDSQKELEKILLPQQQDRLKQIGVQSRLARGSTAGALVSDEIAGELGITDAQKEQIRQGADEIEKELREKMERLREEAREKILAMLTPAQRAKLKQMTGEKIEFGSTMNLPGARMSLGGPGAPVEIGGLKKPSRAPIERLPDGD